MVSGRSVILTANLSWMSFKILFSSSLATKVIARPLVPNLPALPTLNN